MRAGNLFEDALPPTQGERFDTLLSLGKLHIERIVSSADIEPKLYVQEQDEWVLLVQGEATLEIDGIPHELKAGDHVFLPAGTPHQVAWAAPGSVWLAVHLHP